MARTHAFIGTALAAAVLVAVPVLGAAGLESPSTSPAGAATAAAPVSGDEAIIRMIDDVVPELERTAQRERAEAVARASAEEPAALEAAAVAKGEADAAAAAAEAAAQAAAAEAAAVQAAAAAAAASAPTPAAGSTAGSSSGASSAPACAGMPGGGTAGAPGAGSPLGVAGTTSSDLAQFAQTYNQIRVNNCLPPIPFQNIRYDSCMEQRLFWMAEDPSTDPLSAWGHAGSQRSDGVPSVGCDGNLAGGTGNSGGSVAQKWWDSGSHRASLYTPGASTAGVCILFSMAHGGVPNEPYSFTRAAARWTGC